MAASPNVGSPVNFDNPIIALEGSSQTAATRVEIHDPAVRAAMEKALQENDAQMKENASLHREVGRLEEEVTRLKRMEGMDGDDRLSLLENSLETAERQLHEMKKLLFIESKANPSKHMRKQASEMRLRHALETDIHRSPNTVQQLILLQQRSKDENEDVEMVWAFEFAMPEESWASSGSPHVDIDIEFDDTGNAEGDTSVTGEVLHAKVSHEAWVACEKIFAADLTLHHVIPIDGRTIIIGVGARFDVLLDEATVQKVQMRLEETKGLVNFHPDLVRFYNSNHGGLNEFKGGNWAPRNSTEEQMMKHWLPDDNLDDRQLGQRQARNHEIFQSSMAQRLVMARLKRLGRYDPEHVMRLSQKGNAAEKALKYVENRCVARRKNITASNLHDMLILHGGYRPLANTVFPDVDGESIIAKIGKLVTVDDQFNMEPEKGMQSLKYFPESDKLTYAEIVHAVRILTEFSSGPGREEVWNGTLKSFYPLHVKKELAYLRYEWGSPKCIFRGVLIGFDPEIEPKIYDEGPPKKQEKNTFGSCQNQLHEHAWPWSLVYQPLEEIRDYFGDDVGLYFSWLGKYTKMLFLMSMFGCIVMVAQPFYGGVDKNPLSLVYSVYVGLWSIGFLEAWVRRENELRFLWGTQQLSEVEEPRLRFEGVIETNPETGRQVLQHTSMPWHYAKILMSQLFCISFIIFTIISALFAQMTRYIPAHNNIIDPATGEYQVCTTAVEMEEIAHHGGSASDDIVECTLLQLKAYELLSAALNLSIITSYGVVFEAMAEALVEWENHRSESQHDNSVVSKVFLFQFVNNYFVLFYIAYMREFEDPISKQSNRCANGNCLPELQVQLLVVFTGKTIGKQIAYTTKPFFYKWFNRFLANRVTKNIVMAAQAGVSVLPPQMRQALDQVTASAGGRNDPVQQLRLLRNVRNSYELQARLMPYKSTFDDFNDRVIQFGYLVLFAPAFPLAPFLALLNNIVEIRTSGYKLTRAYQRPQWKPRSGIGSWLGVLNVLGFLAVLTNASMITFVGDQDAKTYGIFKDDGTDGFISRTKKWELLWKFIGVEHGVLFMRVLILTLSPSFPAWVTDAKEILEYRCKTRYLTQEQLDSEKREIAEYHRKLHDSMSIMRSGLASKTEADIRQMFMENDVDQSGSIDSRELNKVFTKLNVHLTPKEVENARKEMDSAGDSEISADEFMAWLIESRIWHEGDGAPKDLESATGGASPKSS